MIYPEIRNILSPDLEPPNLPDDPTDCEVAFQVLVGPKDGSEEEVFSFTVVTPVRLAQAVAGRGGGGAKRRGGGGKPAGRSSDGRWGARASAQLSAIWGGGRWRKDLGDRL